MCVCVILPWIWVDLFIFDYGFHFFLLYFAMKGRVGTQIMAKDKL